MNIAIVATIVAGLYLDQHGGACGQWAANVAAWAMFAVLWLRAAPRQRPGLIACLAYATLGEMFLSLAWGLYQYRLQNIPLFVPPGHVLLFALGASVARRLPDTVVWLIALAAAPAIAALALTGADTLGPLLLGLLLACIALGPSKKLYATMFVLALLMELYGTWLGNWAWSREVAWLRLTAANPPLAAGAFYCVLDMLVLATLARLRSAPAGTAAGALSFSAAPERAK